MEILSSTPTQWQANEVDFNQILTNQESLWNQIPLLNVNNLQDLKDSSLVRFLGMIQDTHGPEIYLERFETINENTGEKDLRLGKYVDVADCKPFETIILESSATVRSERQTCVAISIPACNPWVKQMEVERFKISTPSSPSTSTNSKRSLNDEASDQMDTGDLDLPNSQVAKKLCTQSPPAAQPTPVVSREHLLNFPIPDDKDSKVCQLKVYGNADLLKLNSMWEFVGFLSVDPSLVFENSREDGMDEVEFQTHNPPPSLIPRLHCVAFREIKLYNPYIEDNFDITKERMRFLRQQLLVLCTQLLLGDEVAAEYLICHLISEVYLRKDFMALGKFSINISNVPNMENLDYPRELYKFLELLCTKSHYLAMSLENMNSLTLVPKKDYIANRLTSSILQLGAGTHLLLDETKMSAGKLNAVGVDNIKALSNTIKNQKVMVDFTYYQIDFECDLPCLVLSEGKSMLPSDSHIILEPDQVHLNTFPEILDAAMFFLTPELMEGIRTFLTAARMVKYELTTEVQDLLQDEVVQRRQREANVTAEELHNLLVLARLLCVSVGKKGLDAEGWRKACTLETKRLDRIKNSKAS